MNAKVVVVSLVLVGGAASTQADDSTWVVDQTSGCMQRSFLEKLSVFSFFNSRDTSSCSKSALLDFHKTALFLSYSSIQQSDDKFREALVSLDSAIDDSDAGHDSVVFSGGYNFSGHEMSVIGELGEYLVVPDDRPALETLQGFVSVKGDRE